MANSIKEDLNAAKYAKLTQKQALELINVTSEELKQLKLKPIEKLTLVEAIACRRKTDYLIQSNKDILDYQNNRPEDAIKLKNVFDKLQNRF